MNTCMPFMSTGMSITCCEAPDGMVIGALVLATAVKPNWKVLVLAVALGPNWPGGNIGGAILEHCEDSSSEVEPMESVPSRRNVEASESSSSSSQSAQLRFSNELQDE